MTNATHTHTHTRTRTHAHTHAHTHTHTYYIYTHNHTHTPSYTKHTISRCSCMHIIDTDAQSYASRTVDAMLCSKEQEKKQKPQQPAEDRRASFTPFVFSVDGVLSWVFNVTLAECCVSVSVCNSPASRHVTSAGAYNNMTFQRR